MTFTEIYLPVFAAMTSVTLLFEGLHFLIGYWLNYRQRARQQEAQEKMLAAGMDPNMIANMSQMMGGGNPQMFFDMPPGMEGNLPTTSGEPAHSHGQYL